jgi:hypothetical protein
LGFEDERIYVPLANLNAEKVVFLDQIHSKESHPFLNNIYSYWEKVQSKLLSNNEVRYCDLFDWWDILLKISEIYRDFPVETYEIFINLSSGSKISAMAGYHACLLGEITPYYARMKNYAIKREKNQPISSGFLKNIKIPLSSIKKPPKNIIQFLDFFEQILKKKNLKSLSKKELIPVMQMVRSIQNQEKDNLNTIEIDEISTKLYNMLKKEYLKPLQDWNFIRYSNEYEKAIFITAEGKHNLAIYRNFYRIRMEK